MLRFNTSTGSNILKDEFIERYYSTAQLININNSTTYGYDNYSTAINTFNNNEYINNIYDPIFVWEYSESVSGVREYMWTNNLQREIADTVYQIYKESDEDDQQFELNLYKLVLELLWEKLSNEEQNTFYDFFNEEKYSYNGVNRIVSEIINSYHNIKFKSENFIEDTYGGDL